MKVHMQVSDGVATFTIPDHNAEKVVRLADYPSGKAIKAEVLTWAKQYGTPDPVGF